MEPDKDKILSNIFEAAGMEPNTIPVETLMLRKRYALRFWKVLRILTLIVFLLILFCPFLFREAAREMRDPVIESSYREGGHLYIQLSDSTKGIDETKCYAMTDDGAVLKPVSYDRKSNEIVFYAREDSLNIYIINFAGSVTHAVYTSFSEK